MNLILEDRPAMAFWLKLIIALTLGITLVLGIVLYFLDPLSGLSMFILTIGLAALFYCILPRSYQIYTDRLKIVLGGPFRLTIPFANIASVARVDSLSAVASSGIRFTTSSVFVLEVKRKRGLNVTISPSGGEYFLQQLRQAHRTYLNLK